MHLNVRRASGARDVVMGGMLSRACLKLQRQTEGLGIPEITS